jgi:hypothetical protein
MQSPFNTKNEVCSTRCHVKTRHATFYVIVLHDRVCAQVSSESGTMN